MTLSKFKSIHFLIVITFAFYIQIVASNLAAQDKSAEVTRFPKNSWTHPIPGKISKLLPVKKSRIWKVSKSSIDTSNNNFHETEPTAEFSRSNSPENEVQHPETTEVEEPGPKLYKRSGIFQDYTTKPEILWPTWGDLSKALGEAEIKTFLSTLPLDVLRNVTSLARKNPQEGERELVQLFMDRRDSESRKKLNRPLRTQYISSSTTVQDYKKSGSEEQLKFRVFGYPLFTSTPLPIFTAATTTSTTFDFEVPKYQEVLPTPNHHSNENSDAHAPFVNSEIPSIEMIQSREKYGRLNSLTNSGYFLPELTTSNPNNPDSFGNAIDLRAQIDDKESLNPINTFKPGVDTFLNPPSEHTGEISRPSGYSDDEMSDKVSSVWIAPSHNELERIQQIPTVQHSSIKLLSQPSNANGVTANVPEGYNFYQNEGSINTEQKQHTSLENPSYHHHFTTKHESPVISHSVSIDNTGVHHHKPSSNNNNNAQNYILSENAQNQESNQLYQPPKSPDNNPEQSPPFFNNGGSGWNPGWGPYPPGYSGWGSSGNSDWGPSEIWNALKKYFKKGGKKSAAEKVFEISIGILSFLAFGGYLIMLIYQVFAVSTTVPMFPLFSPAVPQNPTLFGLMFGRSASNDGSYRFIPNEIFNEKYIEELEGIVKTAMKNVKRDWSSAKENVIA